MALFRASTKKKVLVFVCFDSCPKFVDGKFGRKYILFVDFHDTHLTDLTKQMSEKVAYNRKGRERPLSPVIAVTSSVRSDTSVQQQIGTLHPVLLKVLLLLS